MVVGVAVVEGAAVAAAETAAAGWLAAERGVSAVGAVGSAACQNHLQERASPMTVFLARHR